MVIGKPILMAVDGDAADIIREAECGVIAESGNPDSIANAALILKDASKQEIKKMIRTKYGLIDTETSQQDKKSSDKKPAEEKK